MEGFQFFIGGVIGFLFVMVAAMMDEKQSRLSKIFYGIAVLFLSPVLLKVWFAMVLGF